MEEMPLHAQILVSLQELLSKKKITAQVEEEIRDLCELITRCRFQPEEKQEIVKTLTVYTVMLRSMRGKECFALYLERTLRFLDKPQEEK